MADKAITFGADNGFGALTGWELQTSSDNTQKARATAMDAGGEVVATKLHDEKNDVSATYKCVADTNVIPPAIGALVNGLILTGISISTSGEDYATMTLTGHNHASNAHAAAPALKTYTHGITLSKAYGCQDFLGGTAATDSSPIASSINITCEHVDQNDALGDHLVGENHNCQIEAKTTWCGVPTAEAADGWDTTSSQDSTENTGFVKTEVTGVKNGEMA